jgi:hypothetical protein
MAKLHIEIDHQFEAGPIRALSHGVTVTLTPAAISDINGKAELSDFSLDIVFRNLLEDGQAWAQVDMYAKTSRKKDIFEWHLDPDRAVARVRVIAHLESRKLRAGVPERIKALGDKFEIRLRGFNYKGGRWSGFEAPVIGQDEEGNMDNWHRVEKWSIK